MKKITHLIFYCALSYFAAGQVTVDTVIDQGIYQSFFSYSIHDPLYVTYVLFKGGGDCSRKGMRFKTGGVGNTARPVDYAASGFDEGHLANAEDFAGNCTNEEETFRFYNCVPQTKRLNRGIWKTWETKIRTESQTEKLFVIAGSIFGTQKLGPDQVGVPDNCYKIVLDFQTKNIIHCLIFKNDSSDTVEEITLDDLKKKLKYPLMPASWWKSKHSH